VHAGCIPRHWEFEPDIDHLQPGSGQASTAPDPGRWRSNSHGGSSAAQAARITSAQRAEYRGAWGQLPLLGQLTGHLVEAIGLLLGALPALNSRLQQAQRAGARTTPAS